MTSLAGRTRRWMAARGHDADAQAELAAGGLDLPAGLAVEWLGTAGYLITADGRSLLIDPYVSRAPLAALARRAPLLPDEDACRHHLGDIGDVVGILVGHTHFDHAVDAPALTRMHDCDAYGSTSLRALMGLHGLAERTVVVEPHRRYEIGPFTVTFVPSRHAKLLAGLAVPSSGELTCEHLDGLTGNAYRCGQVWGIRIEIDGFTIYHQGSADVIEDELPTGHVDVFLAGIAGRYASPRYVATMLRRPAPDVIVPGHYDDFFRPFDAPMGFSLNVNLAAFAEEVRAASRTVGLVTLDPPGSASRPGGS